MDDNTRHAVQNVTSYWEHCGNYERPNCIIPNAVRPIVLNKRQHQPL